MNKKALIITNPGEPGTEDYLHGVNKDRDAYAKFLDSAIGGWWYSREVEILERPLVAQVRRTIEGLKNTDYSLVIFSGHGYYSPRREATILALRAGEEINAAELLVRGRKQTVILDCCRKIAKAELRETMMFKAARALPAVDGSRCRDYYEKQIEGCGVSTVIKFACAIDEYSYDTPQGGVYSYSLVRGAHEWAEYEPRQKPVALSVAGAHEVAVAKVVSKRGEKQTPGIEKPRSGPYFPFCVLV